MSSSIKRPQCALLGDSDASEESCAIAEKIGAMLARMNIVLVTGGRGGAMQAACRGAITAGGITVGIIPSERADDANPFCTIVLPTGLGHARNALTVAGADFVIAMGSSAGTLSEICFAWICGKPIFLMRGMCGQWESAIAAGVDRRGNSVIHICGKIEDLENGVRDATESKTGALS